MTEGVIERTLLFYHSLAAVVNGNFAVIGRLFGRGGYGGERFQRPTPTGVAQLLQGVEPDLAKAFAGQMSPVFVTYETTT